MDQENESENDQDQDEEVQSTLDDTFGRGFDDIADTKRIKIIYWYAERREQYLKKYKMKSVWSGLGSDRTKCFSRRILLNI